MFDITKHGGNSVSYRDYREELLGFLRKLIVEKNNVSEEDNEYHIQTVKDIYDETLKYTVDHASRLPTLDEIVGNIFNFNYKIMWELSLYDFYNGLGENGYGDYIDRDRSEDECIETIYRSWSDHLQFDLGWDISKYIGKLLCENNLCYIDDVNIQYKTVDSFDSLIYVNDCQNLLIPQWHIDSLSRRSSWQSEDYIMRLRFVDDTLEYIMITKEDI